MKKVLVRKRRKMSVAYFQEIYVQRIQRSEMGEAGGLDAVRTSGKEWDQWRLWAGLAPDSNQSVSHIGIYTDFT